MTNPALHPPARSGEDTITISRAVLFAAYLAVREAWLLLDTQESPLGYAADEARRRLRRAFAAMESPAWEEMERSGMLPPSFPDRARARGEFIVWRRERANEIANAEFDHLVAAPAASLGEPDETGPLSVDEREELVDWIKRHRAEGGAAWASRLLAAYDTVYDAAYDAVATRSPAASLGEPAERPTPLTITQSEWAEGEREACERIIGIAKKLGWHVVGRMLWARPTSPSVSGSVRDETPGIRPALGKLESRVDLHLPGGRASGDPAGEKEGLAPTSAVPPSSSARVSEDAPGDEPWVVWSFDHDAWRGPWHCGYRTPLLAAGIYTEAEAKNIEDSANRGHMARSARAVSLHDALAEEPDRIAITDCAGRRVIDLLHPDSTELTALRADRDRLREGLMDIQVNHAHRLPLAMVDRISALLMSSPSTTTLEKP